MRKEAFNEALKIAPDSDVKNLLEVVRRYHEETYDLLSIWISTTPRQFLEILRHFVEFDRIIYKNTAVRLFPTLVAEKTGGLFRRTLSERFGEAVTSAFVARLPLTELLEIEQECALDPKELEYQIAMFKRLDLNGTIDALIEYDREWVVEFLKNQPHDQLFARFAEFGWVLITDDEAEEAVIMVEQE